MPPQGNGLLGQVVVPFVGAGHLHAAADEVGQMLLDGRAEGRLSAQVAIAEGEYLV